MKSKWMARIGGLALATALATTAGIVPAVAADEPWERGPVTISVPIDISGATEGIPAEDVEGVFGYNAWCYTPWSTPAVWTGSSARVTVASAFTDNVLCTVDVRVHYCDWNFILYSCDYTRYTSHSGTGGPLFVDSDPPQALGVTPTGTFPNVLGWFRTPGEAQWTGFDSASGIAWCTRQRIEGPDTTGRTLEGVCVDNVGHASPPRLFTYKYDATPPALAPSAPSPLTLGAVAHADPGASDATSGVVDAKCNGGAALDTSTAGTHTVVCTARDAAGNTASADLTYVVGFGFSGFDEPVDPGGINTITAGRSVPLTFQVTSDAAGTPVLDLDPSKVTVTAIGIACDLGETPNLIEETAAGRSGLQNLGDGAYRFVWASPKSYAGSCKLLRVDLGDGVGHTVEFAFTR